jgi:hypothetical protein
MITAAKLAGFFAAHAVWSVSDGEILIPMLGYTDENDNRHMQRLALADLREAVALGKQKLDANEMDANDAVLLYDARLPVGNEKLDAILLELRAYFSPESRIRIAIPYTPASSGRFRVHKPKFLTWENCDDFEIADVGEALFAGVAEHEMGTKIWNENLDESK